MNKLAALVLCALVGCGVDERADSLLEQESDASAQQDAVRGDAGDAGALEQPDAASAELGDAAIDSRAQPDASEPDSGTADAATPFVSQAQLWKLVAEKCGDCHQPLASPATGALPVLKDLAFEGLPLPKPGDHASCSGWDYIVPGHPEQSLLYMKLKPSAPCGAHPAMSSPPTAEQIELIGDAMRSWGVDAGI